MTKTALSRLSLLVASSSALAISLAAPQAALAQTNEEAEEGLNTIVVTATRRSESLQDVPLAIRALDEEQLEQFRIDSFEDYAQLVPGLDGAGQGPGKQDLIVRGISPGRLGVRVAGIGFEPSVAFYLNETPISTGGRNIDLYSTDLSRIEILKGPQGALYGRNAAAGAIVIQTARPGDSLEGRVLVSAAEDNTYTANGYIATPVGDSAGLVVSGSYFHTDGFFFNRFLNDNVVDNQEVWSIDGRFVADIGPNTELDLKARYAKLDGASINFNASFHLPNFAGVNPDFFEDVNEHPFDYFSNIRPVNEQQTFEASEIGRAHV